MRSYLIVLVALAGCRVEKGNRGTSSVAIAPAQGAANVPASNEIAARPDSFQLDIYDVSDVLAPVHDPLRPVPRPPGCDPTLLEPDELETLIRVQVRVQVGGDAWAEPASYELHRGQIIVNQTREGHAAIVRVLRSIRDEQSRWRR